jgi:3'-phosphoadenosine 5'-phosphosulfate (PAPS) 3'-phosphatase
LVSRIQLMSRTSRRAQVGVLGLRAAEWGGDLAKEAQECARVVQIGSQVCLNLASKMKMAEESLGKEMSADDTQAGMSVIKAGDSTPVTAADFAIQAIIADELKKAFPNDRFMGEEDAADLREDPALRAMTVSIAKEWSKSSEAEIMAAIDSGVEPPRGKGERVWILDPIDGTKGFMTNQNYIIGLALVVDGEPVVAAMGNPRLEESNVPSIMVAVKDKGLRYWPARGDGPVPQQLTPSDRQKKTDWLVKIESLAKFRGPTSAGFPMSELNENGPAWLVSRPMSTGSPVQRTHSQTQHTHMQQSSLQIVSVSYMLACTASNINM